MPQKSKKCIRSIDIHDDLISSSAPLIERDRNAALIDLRRDSVFEPVLAAGRGPFDLDIGIEENRLVIKIRDASGGELPMLVLSLKPYKRLIQDYFMIMRSYDAAMKNGKPSQLEAIDMGRRGLHNEGAQLLSDRLADKIEMDFSTARRLFTLICALHESKALLWR